MEPENIELVPCSPEDIDTLADLARKTYYETFKVRNKPEEMDQYLDDAFDPETLREEMDNPESLFYFLKVDGKTAGYLKLNTGNAQTELQDPDLMEIQRIYIDPDFQDSGLGPLMITQAIRIAKNDSKKGIWLGVWEKNDKAMAFYEKYGFEKFGSHDFMMGDDKQLDYMMIKDLTKKSEK
ncbi:GNAT family N-acetyltransferase [Ileibacterium valens]|uniref:GNAT family N-acetyltransferase n=1 Tax=Ileibacterium valens TaxID=1862668 RepID=UPI0024BB246C|nr:GNAT family N-acetyltransferase [Ileibacterium valens]